jgi:hypothetical protein
LTGPCQRYPNATLCALVVRNESGKYVDKNTTTLPNQCSLDALAKSGSRDTDNTPLLYYRFYYEACADEDDWDGSRVFPLVIGVYTFILIILAFAISVAHGGKSGEYGVSVISLCLNCTHDFFGIINAIFFRMLSRQRLSGIKHTKGQNND